ncbi:DUF3302 domain-containing protein [Haloferula chungangensis]|uniref:DUF3302 domain-containing protein n=1 Tax=Haloferula chungangensis TaxID=1048331 RepID=A0ABW2L510_9BACT
MIDTLSIFALIMLIFVVLVVAYAMIIIHDIPYHIAVKRNHPHQDAIHYGGWISLFTLHAIWPFLWIWATLYREDRGYGFGGGGTPDPQLKSKVKELEERLAKLESGGDVATAPVDDGKSGSDEQSN